MATVNERIPGSILTINAGSSSMKFAVFRAGEKLGSGVFDRLGTPDCTWEARLGSRSFGGRQPKDSPEEVVAVLKEMLSEMPLAAVAHRIVHGGERFRDHCIVDGESIATLKELEPLAPEHLPREIRFLEAASEFFPGVASVACFDTIFHREIPKEARTYALPLSVRRAGFRRYGFHGLSYASLVRALDERGALQGRSVLAHLGNGASMAAVRDGTGIDTTMGFTPAAGLVMGTRCGDTDPGIFRFLTGQLGMDSHGIDRLLNHESGLAALSGTSADMRDIAEASAKNHEAALALRVFCHVAKKQAAGMAASLGGLDRLVFSGGIGEHAPGIRSRLCEGLSFLGIRLDAEANETNSPTISAPGAAVEVLVIPSDEEGEMARIADRLTTFPKP